MNMCDACPDITYWDGKLVHSCRLDEWRMFGGYLQAHMLGKRTREEVMASKVEELKAAETATGPSAIAAFLRARYGAVVHAVTATEHRSTASAWSYRVWKGPAAAKSN